MSFRKFMKWLFILAPIIYIWALISGEESFARWLPAELLAIIMNNTFPESKQLIENIILVNIAERHIQKTM